jgi:hypothetical protein
MIRAGEWGKEYRVTWKREGNKPKSKRFAQKASADRWAIILGPEPWKAYGHDPDALACCGGTPAGEPCACGGLTWREHWMQRRQDAHGAKGIPPIEYIRITRRTVGPWQAVQPDPWMKLLSWSTLPDGTAIMEVEGTCKRCCSGRLMRARLSVGPVGPGVLMQLRSTRLVLPQGFDGCPLCMGSVQVTSPNAGTLQVTGYSVGFTAPQTDAQAVGQARADQSAQAAPGAAQSSQGLPPSSSASRDRGEDQSG